MATNNLHIFVSVLRRGPTPALESSGQYELLGHKSRQFDPQKLFKIFLSANLETRSSADFLCFRFIADPSEIACAAMHKKRL